MPENKPGTQMSESGIGTEDSNQELARLKNELNEIFEDNHVPLNARQPLVAAVSKFHSGPLPSPQTLAEYDSRFPGAGNTIIGMAVKEQEHRHFLEKEEAIAQKGIIDHSLKYEIRGQIFGLILGLVLVAACICTALTGHDRVALTIIGFLAASMIVFVSPKLIPLLSGKSHSQKISEDEK